MARIRQVAVTFPLARDHLTRVMRGVTDYAQQHGNWSLHVNPELPSTPVRALAGWHGDGALALVDRAADAKVARGLDLPIVNISSAIKDAGLPRVTTDNHAVGRLAAEHLLKRGFRRFAYYGLRRVWFSQQRGRGFRETLAKHGADCSVFEDHTGMTQGRAWWGSDELQDWLHTLEPPIGLMAAYDYRAAMVIDACKKIGLRVPDDVAVVGVNNDTVICDFCTVPISSVARNDRKVGYEGAALLDRLMRRRGTSTEEILIPPDCVVLRRSSDGLAIDDPLVETVVHHIREHLAEDFSVDHLADLVPLSRRWLQHRFKECLRMTVHDFVCRARVDRAKRLLTDERKLGLVEVARQCGFGETRRLRKVFERLEGTTPGRFRREQKIRSDDAPDGQP